MRYDDCTNSHAQTDFPIVFQQCGAKGGGNIVTGTNGHTKLISNHLFQRMAIRSEVTIMWHVCAHVIHQTADVNAIWGPVWCWDPSLAKSFAKCFGQDGAPKEFRSGFPLQVSGCSRVIFNGEYVQQGQHVLNLKIEVLISKFVLVVDL